MSLAEGTQCSIAYKKYAIGSMASNAEAISATDLVATGAQLLRRVSSSLKLAKDTYKSNEIRPDRQIFDFRHGIRRVTGSISGEWSPGTYFDFFEAALRATRVPAVTGSPADFTSVAASASAKTFTFASGDAAAKGFRVGDIVQFTGLTATGNNSVNYLVTTITGAGTVLGVLPAPTDMAADTTFTVAQTGSTVSMPTSGFVSRKFAFEHQFTDIDTSHLFTECRIGGITWSLPATGLATIEIPVMGRNMELYSAATAPFFTTPTDVNTNGIFAAVNGQLRVGGITVGVVTGLKITLNLNPSSDAVVGQNFAPEVFLGPADVTGDMTFMLEDNTLVADFVNESEIDIVAYLTTASAPGSPAASIYLPRVKLGDAAVAVTGGAAQIVTAPFQALRAKTAGGGIEATTIRITDTTAV